MNLVVFTNYRSRVSLQVLEALCKSDAVTLSHIVFLKKHYHRRTKIVHHIRSFGLRRIAAKTIDEVERRLRVFCLTHLPIEVFSTPKFSFEFAQQHKIPFSIVADANTREIQDILTTKKPDMLLVFSFSQILKKDIFSLPSKGAINIHLGLLPHYRGPEPVFWALYCGENEVGLTFHLLEEGIDTGRVLSQCRLPVEPNSNEQSIVRSLSAKAAQNVVAVLSDYYHDNIIAQKQNGSSSYFSFPTSHHRRVLRKKAP